MKINRHTIFSVKDPFLLYHLTPLVYNAENFKNYVENSGIVVEQHADIAGDRVLLLKEKGALVRNNGKSIHAGSISEACLFCATGENNFTMEISKDCNRSCYHCFTDMNNPVPEPRAPWQMSPGIHNYSHILRTHIPHGFDIKCFGLSGGEPLLYKEAVIDCFTHIKNRFPRAYTRLYTNGDFVDRAILEQLRDVELNEIRFSIKHEDLSGREPLLQKMVLAKDYIPEVMVEMPVIPGFLPEMKALLRDLDSIGVSGINLLEFTFFMHHGNIFRQNNFRVKWLPFGVMFRYSYYGLPVVQSREDALDLLEFALDSNLSLGVHYCSVENRLTSEIFGKNISYLALVSTEENSPEKHIITFSEDDFFFRSIIIAGEENIRLAAEKISSPHLYRIIDRAFPPLMEINITLLPLIKDLKIEAALVYSAAEPIRGAIPAGAEALRGGDFPILFKNESHVRKMVGAELILPDNR
ncbi:MAG: radical SAM protein [bacterium]|nr:radical SAM protein [bacterium]